MAANSGIEWTEATWNCLAGCEAVSPGCALCYAATMTRRLEAMGQADYSGLTTDKHFNGVVRCLPHKLDIPLKRRKPTTYFVNSMSDLFHEDVPDSFIDSVFAVMALADWHTFQVLTKRAERMAKYINGHTYGRWCKIASVLKCDRSTRNAGYPLPNCWLGVSCEDQKRADERIPWLLKTPAAVRFLSCEPLIGPIDLAGDGLWCSECPHCIDKAPDYETNVVECRRCDCTGKSEEAAIDWVIVGGESGHGARPMHPDWVRSLRDQCQAAGVAYFFKQWGEWAPGDQSLNQRKEVANIHATNRKNAVQFIGEDREAVFKIGKGLAGRMLDGREWSEFPSVTEAV